MNLLPPRTVLGTLDLEEVFLDYEGPKLFSARNATGQRYFVVAVDEDDHHLIYVYVAISAERYLAVRSGLLTLRAVLTEPEGDMFVVRSNYSAQTHDVQTIAPERLPDAWLPDTDALLRVPTHTQTVFDPQKLTERAGIEQRSLVALRLERPDLVRTEYPLSDLKDLLRDVQETVYAIAAEIEGRPTAAGMIPARITQESELSLVDLQAASFVVVLAPTLGGQMVEYSLAGAASDQLVSLIASAEDDDTLRASVSRLHERAFSKFRGLLADIADTTTRVNVYLAKPNGDLRETTMSAQQANRGLAIMSEVSTDEEFVNIERAILIGANVRTRAFELRDEATDEKYAGKVAKDALPQIEGLQIGEPLRYTARVAVVKAYPSTQSEPKIVHRLEMIRPLLEGPPVWNQHD